MGELGGTPQDSHEVVAVAPVAIAATTPPDDPFAARLRGFGPVGLAAIVVVLSGNALFVPLSALLVLAWAYRSRTPWRDIGFGRPRNFLLALAIGIVFGIALKLAMKAVVMPLLGADPVNHAFHFLAGNRAAIPATLFLMVVGAGFGEETVFRGYAFERLGKLFGSSVMAKTLIVLVTATWFGLVHYPFQGLAGTQQALIVGLLYGAIYARTGQLWMLMAAHAAFDLTAYAIIYNDWEVSVATYFFASPTG